MMTTARILMSAATVLLAGCGGTATFSTATADFEALPSPSCFDRPMEIRVDGVPFRFERVDGMRFRATDQLGQSFNVAMGSDGTDVYLIDRSGTYKLTGSAERCELTGLYRFDWGNRGISITPAR